MNMVLIEPKKVNLKDIKQIISLERKVFKKNAFSKDLMRNLLENNALFLKLESGKVCKKIIGFIIAIRDQKDRVNMINFLIKPKFQNNGYGSYLLQKTIEEIKKIKEIKRIVLNVQINNSNAIKLYEKFEFKKHPKILQNYYQSGEDAYLMELEINSL